MRRYEISPAIIAAMRSRALAASFKEAGEPLYLHAELPPRGAFLTPDYYGADDGQDGTVAAVGYLAGPEEDDDFY